MAENQGALLAGNSGAIDRAKSENFDVAPMSPVAVDAYTKARRRIAEAKTNGATVLYLRINALDRLPPEIADLSDLKELDLSATRVEDISHLAAMTRMQALTLDYTKVKDISNLAAMTEMQSLRLGFTKVEDISPVAAMTAMQSLDLRNTQVTDLSPLAGMGAMQALDLDSTQVDLSGLVAPGAAWEREDRELRTLWFKGVPVEDEALATLGERSPDALVGTETLVRLRELRDMAELGDDFDSDPMSPEALNAFNKAKRRIANAKATGADELYLCITALNRLPPEIADLSDLRQIDLSRTEVEDISHLAAMTGMQTLNLIGTQVKDLSPLAGMVEMKELGLSNTKVEDISPLAGMEEMRELNLDYAPLRDITPLARMVKMETLQLASTWIEDLTPLKYMIALCELSIKGTQVADSSVLDHLKDLRLIR